MVCKVELDKEIDELRTQLSNFSSSSSISNNNNNNNSNSSSSIAFAEFDEPAWGSLLVQGIGAGTAGLITSLMGRFVPLPAPFLAIIAGLGIKRFVKNNLARQYAHGLIIAGIGNLVAGFASGALGGTGTGTTATAGGAYPYPVR